MEKEKLGFCVSLGLTIFSLIGLGTFTVLTCESKNCLETDEELQRRSQFELFGYYDKNIELPKDKLLKREYKNNNSISEEYYDLFFGFSMGFIPLFGFSFISFGFFCDCLGI